MDAKANLLESVARIWDHLVHIPTLLIVLSPDQIFHVRPAAKKKQGLDTFIVKTQGLIIKCISILSHQSDCSGNIYTDSSPQRALRRMLLVTGNVISIYNYCPSTGPSFLSTANFCTLCNSLVPRPPPFLPSVCVHNNTQKWKSSEK